MANRTTRSPERDVRFLEALAAGATVSRAAQAAGYARPTLYKFRAADVEFAQAWDDALEAGTDELEDEALRRAKDGYEEPRFYEGQLCGHVRKYSDTLLIFLLKARRPEKYSDRVVNTHQGPGGGPITEIRRIIIEPGTKPLDGGPTSGVL
jgi:Bacteriophage Sf6, terminase small subunit-like